MRAGSLLCGALVLGLVVAAAGQSEDTGLCLALKALVDALNLLVTGGVICPLESNEGLCPGLRSTLTELRKALVDGTLCPLVGG